MFAKQKKTKTKNLWNLLFSAGSVDVPAPFVFLCPLLCLRCPNCCPWLDSGAGLSPELASSLSKDKTIIVVIFSPSELTLHVFPGRAGRKAQRLLLGCNPAS